MRGASMACLCALALAGDVRAQDVRAQEPVAARGVPIARGFTPDPLRLEGTTAGATPVSGRAPGCRGYVGERPDQVVELASRFGFLRFFVTSRENVTLAVRAPDGSWRCSGRPLLGAPREDGAFEPGRYEVWIGSASPNTQVAYALHVTEFRSVNPATGQTLETATAGTGADVGLAVGADTGRFDDRQLPRSFLPDPQSDEGRAGGSIGVGMIGGGCRGRVEAQPNHVLELREPLDYFRIEIEAEEGATSLIVRAPSGAYLCSAPDDGPPRLERDAWAQGRYRIWVGSRDREATPDYRIVYSETLPSSD